MVHQPSFEVSDIDPERDGPGMQPDDDDQKCQLYVVLQSSSAVTKLTTISEDEPSDALGIPTGV